MKPILITILLAFIFIFALKSNSSSVTNTNDKSTDQVNLVKTIEIECATPVNGLTPRGLPPCYMYPSKGSANNTINTDSKNRESVKVVRRIKIECAVSVNGFIRGRLPPCDMFSKIKPTKKKFKPPYVVDNIAYKDFMDYRDQMQMQRNAESEAYNDFRAGATKRLNEYHKERNEIAYASTRAKVKARDARNEAYLAKKKETKILREKGAKGKSSIVACKNSAGKTYYANNCEIGIGK